MSVIAATAAIDAGELSSEELVSAYVEQIDAKDAAIEAWEHFDAEYALTQARNADTLRRRGQQIGPLHGIPIGVKDIFDTHDMPTEDGTIIHKGRTPADDASSVEQLRQAGAIIMGKTVTTEMAVLQPSKTKNPHNPEYSPGGSSSGSAAAVAASMVPLAIGTQTNGSVIRPASYCGVVGYKPTHGLISRYRVLLQSLTLDHVGVFARDVNDAALLAEQMMAYDKRDPSMQVRMPPKLLSTIAAGPLVPPKLAYVKTPFWDTHADDDVKAGFTEIADFMGDSVEELDLSHLLDEVPHWHKIINEVDIAKNYNREYKQHIDLLSDNLRQIIERGRKTLAIEYNHAIDHIAALNTAMDEIMVEYDAILTPATTGEAPKGFDTTGDPIFCTPWSFCGMPAITLPLMQGSNNLPLGVQLTSAKGDDARLLRTADWLTKKVNEGS